jgi:hypothetical protein
MLYSAIDVVVTFDGRVGGAHGGRDALDMDFPKNRGSFLVVRDLLSLRNLGQLAIVENEIDDSRFLRCRGQAFECRHQERPVADNPHDLSIGVRKLGADRCRNAVSHAVEVRRRDELSRAPNLEKFGREKCVVPVVYGNDSIVIE